MQSKMLKQVVRVFENRAHFGLNKVKTRAEVNRTKKKLYKQKGTGGARHGAKSAPVFVGGGKAHGPKGIKRELRMPKKMIKKALSVALTFKLKNKDTKYIENLEKIKKTQDAAKVIEGMSLKGKILIVLSDKNKEYVRFFRNIDKVKVLILSNISVYEITKYKNILLEKGIK